jgi:hypothetical protein
MRRLDQEFERNKKSENDLLRESNSSMKIL